MKLAKRIIIAIIIVIIVYIIIFLLLYSRSNNSIKLQIFDSNIVENGSVLLKEEKKKIYSEEIVGYLTINNIGMEEYSVKSGVDKETLKDSIGHFSNTSIFDGNVCLAAHNYSIENSNLFRDINKLSIGDSIIYETKFEKREYKIYKIYQVQSTDFSILENTKDNILTLVTCIDSNKDIRLCIKALEFKEE